MMVLMVDLVEEVQVVEVDTYGGTATSNKSNYTGAGTATAYGNSGGRGYHNPANFVNGGGGGGAGAVGLDSPTGNHPQPQNDGGAGKPFSLTGTPIWFAGGGGGGGHYTGSNKVEEAWWRWWWIRK